MWNRIVKKIVKPRHYKKPGSQRRSKGKCINNTSYLYCGLLYSNKPLCKVPSLWCIHIWYRMTMDKLAFPLRSLCILRRALQYISQDYNTCAVKRLFFSKCIDAWFKKKKKKLSTSCWERSRKVWGEKNACDFLQTNKNLNNSV